MRTRPQSSHTHSPPKFAYAIRPLIRCGHDPNHPIINGEILRRRPRFHPIRGRRTSHPSQLSFPPLSLPLPLSLSSPSLSVGPTLCANSPSPAPSLSAGTTRAASAKLPPSFGRKRAQQASPLPSPSPTSTPPLPSPFPTSTPPLPSPSPDPVDQHHIQQPPFPACLRRSRRCPKADTSPAPPLPSPSPDPADQHHIQQPPFPGWIQWSF